MRLLQIRCTDGLFSCTILSLEHLSLFDSVCLERERERERVQYKQRSCNSIEYFSTTSEKKKRRKEIMNIKRNELKRRTKFEKE